MQEKRTIGNTVKRRAALSFHLVVRAVRRYLLTGVMVTAPVFITLYLAYAFVTFVDGVVDGILPHYRVFMGSGVILSVLFFIGAGWLASNILGRVFIGVSEFIMTRMPFMRTLYNAVKQVIETLLGSQAKAFREVVLVEFPRPGAWTIGFVTSIPNGDIKSASGIEEVVTVFVPTAPSPVNGFMLFLPRHEVKKLDMSIDDAVKMVVSMGIVAPMPRPSTLSHTHEGT
ncbi:MAG: DUF502 domain-containing protein [Alphaproteobacteria bacterium]